MTITYKGHSATIDMPGWYCEGSDESIHTGDDMLVSHQALNRLKARVEGLFPPEEVRRIDEARLVRGSFVDHLLAVPSQGAEDHELERARAVPRDVTF